MSNVNFDNDDVPTVEAHMDEPFGMFMDEPWVWLQDACNQAGENEEYNLLDRIFACLTGDLGRDELSPELAGLTDDALKAEYSKRFPILFGKALQAIGKQLENGEVRVVVEYP
jgi:hypothetical protein